MSSLLLLLRLPQPWVQTVLVLVIKPKIAPDIISAAVGVAPMPHRKFLRVRDWPWPGMLLLVGKAGPAILMRKAQTIKLPQRRTHGEKIDGQLFSIEPPEGWVAFDLQEAQNIRGNNRTLTVGNNNNRVIRRAIGWAPPVAEMPQERNKARNDACLGITVHRV